MLTTAEKLNYTSEENNFGTKSKLQGDSKNNYNKL